MIVRPNASPFNTHANLTPLTAMIYGSHFDDPNIDREHVFDGEFDEESPYPEVRSAVANTDDPEMPVSTLRVWVIGILWAIIIPGMNQFFFFRYPSVLVGGIIAQLLSFPIGQAAARWTPKYIICGVNLNPCACSRDSHKTVS